VAGEAGSLSVGRVVRTRQGQGGADVAVAPIEFLSQGERDLQSVQIAAGDSGSDGDSIGCYRGMFAHLDFSLIGLGAAAFSNRVGATPVRHEIIGKLTAWRVAINHKSRQPGRKNMQ
jgi:hypothetical protein